MDFVSGGGVSKIGLVEEYAAQWLEQERPSVFAALMARLKHGISIPPYQGDDRWVFVEAALTVPSLEGQQRLVASIAHPQDAPFVATYCIGALFAEEPLTLDAAALLDSTDFSLVFESLAVAELGRSLGPPCLRLSERFLNGDLTTGGSGYEVLRERLHRESPVEGVDLGQFQKRIQVLKHDYIHAFGPDVFSFLQALAEPAIQINEPQLEAIGRLMSVWGLSDLFCALLLFRLLGPYAAEQQFVHRRFHEFRPHLSARQSQYVAGILDDSLAETPPRPRSGAPYMEMLLQLFARVHAGFRTGDQATLTDSVIELFELDPLIVPFLPWDRVHRALAQTPRDARAAFLTMLMTDDAVRTRYPRVGMALGKGALIADLQALIEVRRTDVIGALLNQVKALPPRAAGALTRAILDRPIIERLASSLPDAKRIMRELPHLDRARVSSAAISALLAAGQRDLIPETEMRRLVQREVEDLRFHMLQNQLRTGRVKVAWSELERGLGPFFAHALPMTALRLSSARNISSGLAPRLAEYTAARVSNFLILESEYCIKQALSSNLRHGVMLPRFLRAFDDAVQTVWGDRVLLNWEPAAVRERMGEDGLLVLAVRERVSGLIKAHMTDSLNVDEDSEFASRLRTTLAERIAQHFGSAQATRLSALRSTIASAARRELRVLLSRANRALWGSTRRAVVQELKALRRTLRGRSQQELRTYLDFLEANVHEAFQEVRQWMRPTNARSEALPFKLSDVVRLHLLSSALMARDRLKVTSEVVVNDTRYDNLRIHGRYLGFFEEVVRNLLSNAFKGSGDDLKTQAEVQLTVSGRRMVLRCTNMINPAELERVIGRYRSTVALAQKQDKLQAGQDQKSGFPKIRVAYLQTFGVQPRINIPPISLRHRKFVVELGIDMPRDDLFMPDGRRK